MANSCAAMLVFALFQAQGQTPPLPLEDITAPAMPAGVDILAAVFSASLVVQLTLLILIVMSVISWAVIFQKYVFFKRLDKANIALKEAFLKDGSFEEIEGLARLHKNSPLSVVFIEGWNELQKLLQKKTQVRGSRELGLENIGRSLRKAGENELSVMETGLGFLATVGSSCPFIGLFGTVFGIMSAFKKIAISGGAGLDVVAPGIAEALLATGIGLFAAIPAVIFYNSFQSKIRAFNLTIDNFSADFLNVAGRNFFHQSDEGKQKD